MILRTRKWFRVLAATLVLAAVVFLLPQAIWSPLRVVTGIVARPFEQVFAFVGFKFRETFSTFGSIGRFKEENARLFAENLDLRAGNVELEDLRKENAALRAELGAPEPVGAETVAADVIGWNTEESGRWIVVDRGSLDGIGIGMPVVVGRGVLIGQTDEVLPTSSRVILLTHPESVVNVLDEGTEAQGVLRGEYGLGLVFDMVPQTDTLREGDRVVTSGLGGRLPRALLVGTIGEVRHTPDRLFQQAAVEPAVPVEKVRFVEILKKF